MYVQIVNFNLKNLSDADFRSASSDLAPMFAAVPGLLSKVWLADQDSNTYGGVYLWRDKQAMDEYAASDLFKAVATNPNFANLTSRAFDILDGPSRTTAGALHTAYAEATASR
jgi:quinol monooxygenase YgiN